MSKWVPAEVIEKTLRGITIPSRPKVLVQIDHELKKNDPDPRVVARLIGGDVGLSAAVLKTVNSPFFGLSRKISSVPQAVGVLGMKTAAQIVNGLLLRSSFVAGRGPLEHFWDNAEKVAGIASHIALTIPGGPRDDAYCFALFHDVGIPMLLQKLPGYAQTLLLASGPAERSFTVVERERHSTDHATLGYLVAKGWFLPEAISEGILYHHDASVFADPDAISPRALTLIAINALAEHVHDEYVRLHDTGAWELMGGQALAHLGLSEGEYADLREELSAMLH